MRKVAQQGQATFISEIFLLDYDSVGLTWTLGGHCKSYKLSCHTHNFYQPLSILLLLTIFTTGSKFKKYVRKSF